MYALYAIFFFYRVLLRSILLVLSIVFVSSCANPEGQSPLYRNFSPQREQLVPADTTFTQTWNMTPGLLRGQLENWARNAGFTLVWKIPRDYYLQSPVQFFGTFQAALTSLLTGMQQRGNALRAIIYKGNNVVLVTEE